MWLVVLSLAIIGLDQLLKNTLSLHLQPGEFLAGPIFDVRLVHNTGVAFGLFQNNNIFFILISSVAVIALCLLLYKVRAKFFLLKLSIVMVMAGAVSNLIDRLRFGFVVDYIDFHFWPVFNIADSAITIGTITLLILMFSDSERI